MNKKPSPEEKLLNIIKNEQGNKKPAARKNKGRKNSKIKILNIWLLIILLPAAGIFLASFFSSPEDKKEIAMVMTEIEPEPAEIGQSPPYSYYSDAIDENSLFSYSDSGKTYDIKMNYRLIGIMETEKAQVIIQNIKTKESLFLNVGDKFGEGILVKEIKEGAVVLRYKGEDVHLNL